MRFVFSETLLDLAKADERICLITPDMGYGILDKFKETFPERFFNLGITEQNSISVAAGMALAGLKPVVYSIIPFVAHRCVEQTRVDVSYMNLDVKIVGVGSGFEYGAAGATHHGTEDIALMRALPNMLVLAPGDKIEMEMLTKLFISHVGPGYMRIGRHGHEDMNWPENVSLGKASIIEHGEDKAVIATGNMLPVAYDYCQSLKKQGHNPTLVSMHTIKPLDSGCIMELLQKGDKIYTLEEHTIIGGLGSAVAEVMAESGICTQLKRIGINDCYSHIVGSARYLREKFNLDVNGIIKTLGI